MVATVLFCRRMLRSGWARRPRVTQGAVNGTAVGDKVFRRSRSCPLTSAQAEYLLLLFFFARRGTNTLICDSRAAIGDLGKHSAHSRSHPEFPIRGTITTRTFERLSVGG